MRLRPCLFLAPVALTVALTGTAVTPAAADPAPASVALFYVVGNGPDDLIELVGTGYTPGDPATVELVGAAVSYELPSITVSGTGAVITPTGYRTPVDLPQGTYHVVLSDASGDTASGPAFTVAAPAANSPVQDPGADVEVLLTGAGGDADVVRTVTVDDAPATFTSFEVRRGVNNAVGRMGVRLHVPATAPAGSRHAVVITQDRHPAFTVSTSYTVTTPGVGVSYPGPDGYGSRQAITIGQFGFGPSAVLDASVTDARGHVFDLGGLSPTASRTVDLPGLAPGVAALTVTNSANGARATTTLLVGAPSVTAPTGLAPGTALLSSDGVTRLALGTDGNLVVTRQYLPKWSSATTGRTGARLTPQADGSWALVTPGAHPAVVWSTRSPTTDRPTRLVAQDDGNVVLYAAHGTALWSTRTKGGDLVTLAAGSYLGPNGRLRAGVGDYTATMQTDGRFVLVRGTDAGVLFATPTAHNPGAAITLQPDGNLVVYSSAGKALWANGVRSGPGSRLVMQLDGNLVEYSSAGKALWASNTAGR